MCVLCALLDRPADVFVRRGEKNKKLRVSEEGYRDTRPAENQALLKGVRRTTIRRTRTGREWRGSSEVFKGRSMFW